jgi:uncharacterized SAM-binding protein YcdF (DUF218 family)
MTAGETTTYVLGQLALPPTSLVVAALAGALLALRRRVAGVAVAVSSLLALLALSTSLVAHALIRTLEPPPLADAQRAGAQAIVILAGGRVRASPDWGGDTVNASTLRRIRYGARLARETGLPVLLAGGNPDRTPLPEARLMQAVLEREFGIKARWIEDRSDTTAENARFTAAILLPLGIRRVLLVTDAYHPPRARRDSAVAGLDPIAAPTGYIGRSAFRPQQLVPNAEALRVSNLALREWAAGLWYRLRN